MQAILAMHMPQNATLQSIPPRIIPIRGNVKPLTAETFLEGEMRSFSYFS